MKLASQIFSVFTSFLLHVLHVHQVIESWNLLLYIMTDLKIKRIWNKTVDHANKTIEAFLK